MHLKNKTTKIGNTYNKHIHENYVKNTTHISENLQIPPVIVQLYCFGHKRVSKDLDFCNWPLSIIFGMLI